MFNDPYHKSVRAYYKLTSTVAHTFAVIFSLDVVSQFKSLVDAG